MNIHVNGLRVDLHVDEVERKRIFGQKLVVGVLHRVMQVCTFDEAVIDEEELLTSCFFCELRFADEAGNIHDGGIFMYGNEALVVAVAKNSNEALPQRSFFQMKKFGVVMMKRQPDLRMRDGNTLKFLYDVP